MTARHGGVAGGPVSLELSVHATNRPDWNDPTGKNFVPGQLLIAQERVDVVLSVPWSVDVRPVYGSLASRHRVGLRWFDDSPEDGWVSGRVSYEFDNHRMPELPLTFYTGAATDWPTGIVRFAAGCNVWQSTAPRFSANVFTLSVRRAA